MAFSFRDRVFSHCRRTRFHQRTWQGQILPRHHSTLRVLADCIACRSRVSWVCIRSRSCCKAFVSLSVWSADGSGGGGSLSPISASEASGTKASAVAVFIATTGAHWEFLPARLRLRHCE